MRLGFDIDGVLASFWDAYERLCIEEASGANLFGRFRWPPHIPTCWTFPEHYGYSDDVVKAVWARIKASETFWTELHPMPDMATFRAMLPAIAGDDVWFVTDRPGAASKQQTIAWLSAHGIRSPEVIISADKGGVARQLCLDFYVDDRGENVKSVEDAAPLTTVVLIDRPYNQHVAVRRRVPDLARAFVVLDDLREKEKTS